MYGCQSVCQTCCQSVCHKFRFIVKLQFFLTCLHLNVSISYINFNINLSTAARNSSQSLPSLPEFYLFIYVIFSFVVHSFPLNIDLFVCLACFRLFSTHVAFQRQIFDHSLSVLYFLINSWRLSPLAHLHACGRLIQNETNIADGVGIVLWCYKYCLTCS